jgi:hypothetical protein
MIKRSKVIWGVAVFLIGYIIASYVLYESGFILQGETKTDNQKLSFFGLPKDGLDPNQLKINIAKASFFKALNPFYYFLNPTIYLFMAEE